MAATDRRAARTTATPSDPIPVHLTVTDEDPPSWRVAEHPRLYIDPIGDGRRYRIAWVARRPHGLVVGAVRQVAAGRDHRSAVPAVIAVDAMHASRDGDVRRAALDLADAVDAYEQEHTSS